MKIWLSGLVFLVWYVGASLFIMYRMRGDDLDILEKEVERRQKVKK